MCPFTNEPDLDSDESEMRTIIEQESTNPNCNDVTPELNHELIHARKNSIYETIRMEALQEDRRDRGERRYSAELCVGEIRASLDWLLDQRHDEGCCEGNLVSNAAVDDLSLEEATCGSCAIQNFPLVYSPDFLENLAGRVNLFELTRRMYNPAAVTAGMHLYLLSSFLMTEIWVIFFYVPIYSWNVGSMTASLIATFVITFGAFMMVILNWLISLARYYRNIVMLHREEDFVSK